MFSVSATAVTTCHEQQFNTKNIHLKAATFCNICDDKYFTEQQSLFPVFQSFLKEFHDTVSKRIHRTTYYLPNEFEPPSAQLHYGHQPECSRTPALSLTSTLLLFRDLATFRFDLADLRLRLLLRSLESFIFG
jgi:hypothetical protein